MLATPTLDKLHALKLPALAQAWTEQQQNAELAGLGFDELRLARADGTYGRLLGKLARMDVLLLDDWGLAPPQDQERRDLLEILEDRYGSRSTIVTSQLPPAQWHDHIGEPTLADAICDRLLHNAHRIVLQGPSRRKEGKLDS